MGNCAGIDWASEKHDLLVENPAGEEVLAGTFAHSETGIAGMCAALTRHEVELVAIERPDGLLVDRMLDAGIRILPLHPNQVAASRDRFRASGGKSDRFDRFVLCELARTDFHRFRILEPDSDQTKALRALTRSREDLVTARVAMGNQLRAELERFWPGPVRMFSAIDSPVSLAFLAKYPSPPDAKALGEKRLAAFLKAHGSTKAKAADHMLAQLRDAPTGRTGRIETECRRSIVLALVHSLSTMVSEINRLEAEIGATLAAHPDGPVFRSFFASSTSVLCPATLLAESAIRAPAIPIVMRSPPRPEARLSLTNRANAKAHSFAGRATTASATRCRPSPTPSDAGIPGPPTSTRPLARAATTTDERYAPSAVAWRGSSGSAGPPTPPTTPTSTPRSNDTSPSPSPTPRAPGPTSPPPNA
jgi:transposase